VGNEDRQKQTLSPEETQRYSRHLLLPEVGPDGQRKLKAARVLCIGAGGLGSPVAMYLAASGVGTLGLVDADVVNVTNLQRQIIHGTPDVGRPKLQSAAQVLHRLNPGVEVVPFETRLTSENALEILPDFDVIIDGTDNFATRYLVNDACVLLGKPNVYGSVLRFDGQVSVFWSTRGPCYRCLFPEPPPPGTIPSCAEGGVLGVLPGTIGTLQATEAIKLILGVGDPLIGRLLLFNALKMRWREVGFPRDRDCPVCGNCPSITRLGDYDLLCGVPESLAGKSAPALTVAELRARLDRGERPVVVDVREPHELLIASLPNTLHIPLSKLPLRTGELDPDDEIVLLCRSGMRSLKALDILRSRGFHKLFNLTGGLLAWSEEIDPSVPKY